MPSEAQAIASARTQYRAMFRSMAASSVHWHLYGGSASVVLLREDAQMDVLLPIIVRHINAMSEQTMVNALSTALRHGAPA